MGYYNRHSHSTNVKQSVRGYLSVAMNSKMTSLNLQRMVSNVSDLEDLKEFAAAVGGNIEPYAPLDDRPKIRRVLRFPPILSPEEKEALCGAYGQFDINQFEFAERIRYCILNY